VSSGNPGMRFLSDFAGGLVPRQYLNAMSAGHIVASGAPGFFELRVPPPYMLPAGSPAALSYYDTAPLRDTLLELVDFDILNSGNVRFAVGAVNVRTGNQIYFDNTERTIRPEHIMASGALPPGFPHVEIDGEPYWDGGIVSNTPLQYVLDNHDRHTDSLVFQFDLFSARGETPQSVWDVESREKDIRFSSRTRYTTDRVSELIRARAAMHRLYERLPADLRDSDDVRLLMQASHPGRMTIVHLIHRPAVHELSSRDYEFSRRSMLEHWNAGAVDARYALHHRKFIERKSMHEDLVVVDATADLPKP